MLPEKKIFARTLNFCKAVFSLPSNLSFFIECGYEACQELRGRERIKKKAVFTCALTVSHYLMCPLSSKVLNDCQGNWPDWTMTLRTSNSR